MPQLLAVDEWGFAVYDRMIAVPRDGDYSRIDPRYHALLKRLRPDMTTQERADWLDESFAVRHRAQAHDEARAKIIAIHRSTLLAMPVPQRRDWIEDRMLH